VAISKLTKDIIGKADSNRPAFTWLEQNYEKIEAAFMLVHGKRKFPWTAVAAAAAEAGVRNKKGEVLSPQAFKAAWRTLEAKRPALLAAKAAVAAKYPSRHRRKPSVAPLVQSVGGPQAMPSRQAPSLPSELVERPRNVFVSKGGARLRSLLPLSEREPRNE
jgi:hypothetical protein